MNRLPYCDYGLNVSRDELATASPWKRSLANGAMGDIMVVNKLARGKGRDFVVLDRSVSNAPCHAPFLRRRR